MWMKQNFLSRWYRSHRSPNWIGEIGICAALPHHQDLGCCIPSITTLETPIPIDILQHNSFKHLASTPPAAVPNGLFSGAPFALRPHPLPLSNPQPWQRAEPGCLHGPAGHRPHFDSRFSFSQQSLSSPSLFSHLLPPPMLWPNHPPKPPCLVGPHLGWPIHEVG